jgi:uncharacterized protein (TIGR03435 family)
MGSKYKCLALPLLLIVSCAPAAAQDARFASATVRPSVKVPGDRSISRVEPDGGYFASNVTLKQLIEAAYRRSGFDSREIAGGPEWIGTTRYDVVAQAGGLVLDPDGFPRQSLLMLRSLLAERFGLQIHTETQQRPAYALVPVGNTRPGLTPSTTDCAAQLQAMMRREKVEPPFCGASPYPGRLMAHAVTMPDLAALIARWVDRPVIDRSGLSGAFTVNLEGVEVKPPGPFGPSYRHSDTKRSIFVHMQEQLGLKLEPVVAPIDVIVVDRAERPSGAQAARLEDLLLLVSSTELRWWRWRRWWSGWRRSLDLD